MQLIVFYTALLVLQGYVAVLLAPLPAPDLFVVAMLTLLWRLPAWQLVLIGYGIGLLQDIVGHGSLGIHALGIAGAALLAALVKSRINQAGLAERLLTVLSALLGKWLVIALLLLWLGRSRNPLEELLRVAPLEALFTVLASVVILPLSSRLLDRSALLRKELL